MTDDDQPESGTDWFPLPVPAPGRTRYTDLGLRPDATAEEVRVATARRVRALKNAGATQEEIADLNASALTRLEHRDKHDEEHPPCALMRLQPTWSGLFDDPVAALERARRDLASLLAGQDDPPIAFPRATDLHRTDFSADFRHNRLLDREDIG